MYSIILKKLEKVKAEGLRRSIYGRCEASESENFLLLDLCAL
jgi:hypothetical protein